MQVDKFDFEVPESLIALNPSNPRDSSKMVEVSKHLEIYKFNN